RYELADIICYLPLDFRSHIRRFLNLVNPSALIVMRYDIWPNSIFETFKKNIPIFLVDATMKKHSLRKSWLVKNFHKQIFSCFKKILTVSSVDSERFAKFGLNDSLIEEAGVTRYDRVYMKSQEALTKKIIAEKIIENKSVFVAGSTWREDEEVLFPALLKLHEYEKNLISIIVPHEPTIQNLEIIEYELNQQLKTIRFSYLTHYDSEKIIIIDSIGILLSLYAYAHVAFVGGGFHFNVHNVLEPAVYGIPVIFGPKHLSSQEAEKLIKAGGGFEVKDKFELFRVMRNFFIDENARVKAGECSRKFVQSNIGATEKIINTLNRFL
ncbi:MAG: 3-deoxy-D-manno-octulosonic acid transferase, partial [Ignavibacteria bacterium]|nr:3-deoxy-D-manno-octulosonic acid transferase [Ignavibacteria bacterium]